MLIHFGRFFIRKIYFIFALLSILCLKANAQRTEVERVLLSYGIDVDILQNNARENTKSMAYDLKQITAVSSTEKIELASFNGLKPKGSQWELKSVNGKLPTSGQVKNFIKAHPDDPPIPIIDEDTYTVVSIKDNILVIEFTYDVNKLTSENSFLKDCKGKLFINTASKLLERQEIENLKPLKIKGVKIIKLLTSTYFIFDKNLKRYFNAKEVTNLVVQLLMLTSDSVITSEYSNYMQP